MAGAWVLAWRIPAPIGRTILVRQGGSAFFAAHSPVTGWRMLVPGGNPETIEEPAWWYCDEDEVAGSASPVRDKFMTPPAPVTRRGQFLLDFSDSKTQSQGRRGA